MYSNSYVLLAIPLIMIVYTATCTHIYAVQHLFILFLKVYDGRTSETFLISLALSLLLQYVSCLHIFHRAYVRMHMVVHYSVPLCMHDGTSMNHHYSNMSVCAVYSHAWSGLYHACHIKCFLCISNLVKSSSTGLHMKYTQRLSRASRSIFTSCG